MIKKLKFFIIFIYGGILSLTDSHHIHHGQKPTMVGICHGGNVMVMVMVNLSYGATLFDMKNFAGQVEEKFFTWQTILLHIVCHMEDCVMWIHYNLFPVPYFAPRDKFRMYAVLSWFTLFQCKIHVVAIYVLLCGAKIYLKSCLWSKNWPKVLSVEQKWQMWCMGDGDDSRQGTPHTSQSEETRVWQRRSQQNYNLK